MTRVIVAEWLGDSDLAVRLAVRDEETTKALLLYAEINLVSSAISGVSMWRCQDDSGGERCRVLGGLSTHTDVSAELMQGALDALGPNRDQEALFAYLEGEL